VLGLVVALLVAGFLWWRARPAEVAALSVKAGRVEIVLSVVGRVRPDQLVDVRSPNPGQIVAMFHDEGDRVEAGAPLAVVRSRIEQAQTEAEAARERAARAEVTRARLAKDRVEALAGRGFATRASLDEARAALLTAEAGLAAAAATRRAAAARAGEFTIRAPMAGMVLVRPVDNGQVIAPDTNLFQLGSGARVELRAEADEAYADALRPGMAARAALTGSDAVFAARVTEVSPRVDPVTGGRALRLRPVDNQRLPSGRSVDLTIIVAAREKGIVIPRQAVLNATTAPAVYLIDAKGIVRERRIALADWPSQDAIIDSGLAAGDMVILTPAETVPGARVKAVSPARAQPAPSS
jgi:RND family efflux transporter MFP subunit